MKPYATESVRTVCICGGQGEGKTSLTEALLFNAGVATRLGRVEDGTTVTDADPDEIQRRISINLAVSCVEQGGVKINLLTAPGYADFAGELAAGLAVSEAALVVIGADSGVTPFVEDLWQQIGSLGLPAAIVVNKLDRDTADFSGLLSSIRERLSPHAVAVNAPNAVGEEFSSVISLLGETPPALAPLHEAEIEEICSDDDELTEEFLEGKPIPAERLARALREEFAARKIFPVLCVSAVRNIGTRECAAFIADFFPAPRARGEGLNMLVFKTISEPGMGQINLARVWSGAVTPGVDVHNITRDARDRVGQLSYLQGKKKTEATEARAGDIVALLKLHDARTGDTLAAAKDGAPVGSIILPEPLYVRAIAARSKNDDEKLGAGLAQATLESPTIRHGFNAETREITVSALGAMQLEIMVKRIKTRYGIDIDLKAPRVPYKETVHGRAEAQGKYKRQSGGRGQYGDCWLRIEPLARGAGIEFADKVVGGAIPRNFIPAVEKGVREAMEAGVIAGYQVVDARVTVYDGSYHDVDSSDMAFKIAGAMALRAIVAQAKPVILEPIMELEVIVPDAYMGAVMGDLNARRGRVLGMDKAGSKELVRARVPLGELAAYAVDLRSITKGSGRFSIKFAGYEEAPHDVSQPLVDQHQKHAAAAAEK